MRKILYIIFTCLAPLYGASQMMMANTYDLDAFAFMQRGSYNQNFVQVNTDGSTVRQGGNFMGSIQQLVVDLKRTNLWDSLHVIYPMGSGADMEAITLGSVSSQAYQRTLLNLKATTNTLLRVVSTQNNVAVTTNGMRFGFAHPTNATSATNQAYNTGVPQNIYGSFNIMSLSVYSMTDINNRSPIVEMGVANSSETQAAYIVAKRSLDNRSLSSIGNTRYAQSAVNAVTDTRGLFTANRTSTTNLQFWQNTTLKGTDATANTDAGISSGAFFLGALHTTNTSTAQFFTTRTIGYADIGRGISAVGVARKYEIVNRYFQNINRPTF